MSNLADTLERFRRGPELLAVVLTGVYGEEIDFAPAPGRWSIRQIVAHLADTEIVAAQWFRQVLAEENPRLGDFDQDAWANHLDYARRQPKQSLESFRRLRGENYELLKEVNESAFARVGIHTARGPVSLRELVDSRAAHVESHARQLQAIRDEYKRNKGKK